MSNENASDMFEVPGHVLREHRENKAKLKRLASPDDALVEAAAKASAENQYGYGAWGDAADSTRHGWRMQMRAALQAAAIHLREGEKG